jgi:hypothetical protein
MSARTPEEVDQLEYRVELHDFQTTITVGFARGVKVDALYADVLYQ